MELSEAQKAQLAKMREAMKSENKIATKQPVIQQKQKVPVNQPARPLNTKYADLDSLDLTVTRQAGAWNDRNFYNVRIYEVEQLDEDDAVLYGEKVCDQISAGNVTPMTVNMLLRLAVSLRSTSDVDKFLLTNPNELMTNKTEIEVPDAVNDEEDEDDELAAQQAAQLERILKRGKQTAEAKLDRKLQGKPETVAQPMTSSKKEASAAAYSYLAGFLMRLQCRDPSRVAITFETAKNRYSGFYDNGGEVLDSVVLIEDSLRKIKEILARKPEVVSTWVAWAAYAENEKDLLKQDRGLLEYLALQVFAYQGMHVVVQILSIHEITKYPIGSLLRELDCRMTRAAIKEVYNILKNYQKNAKNPERKHYYRYARIWDEGYFSQIQSKHCAQLLYVAAKTVKELGTNAESDPTQIFVVKNLSDTMKNQLDAVASKLLTLVLAADEDDEESGSVWKK